METIKVISLNVEGSKHLTLVLPFLKLENPDVVCLQELAVADIPLFEDELNAKCTFAPMFRREKDDLKQVVGVGVFTRVPVVGTKIKYYVDHLNPSQIFDNTTQETKFKTASFALAGVTLKLGEKNCTLYTTHLPVTDEAKPTNFQRETLVSLLSALEKENSFVLCGDFNAPRGTEIFTALAQIYKDNVPARYTTSIDGTIHRAGQLPYMVDGLFSTEDMRVENVEMRCGVSDHCALISQVSVK